MDRRKLIKGGLAALAGSGAVGVSTAMASESGAKRQLAALAKRILQRNAARIPHHDLVGLADFTAPSWRPRFHIVDMVSGEVSSYLVAHGRGSDPGHTGRLQKFSNEVGSNATSAGAYRTSTEYVGKHGPSMRLDGLDPENSNAYARAIVIHAAWYVSDDMIKDHGKLGRSQGCFAFSDNGRTEVASRLGEGRLLYAGKF